MPRLFQTAALALLIALLPPVAAHAEETLLVFERRTRTIEHRPPSQGGAVPGDTARAEVLVLLGDRRLCIYEPLRVTVLDFDKRRLYRVDPNAGTYSDWSLYAFVAFNEKELQDRLAIRSRLMGGRPGAGPSILELEALFSMSATGRLAGHRESLVDSSRQGHVRIYLNEALAVASLPSETPIPPSRLAMFERFLIYGCNLHPAARRALIESGRVPSQLYYRYRDFDDETQVILTLKNVSSAPEANDPIAAFHQVDLPDKADASLAALLERSQRCAADSARGWREEAARSEAAALDSGRYADAALARAEQVLACGAPAAWPQAVERRARGDRTLMAIQAGQQWKDSTGAARALNSLSSVDRDALIKPHVLDLVAGHTLLGMRNPREAVGALLQGLKGNPCLAGGWADLGRAYLEDREPVLAWLCFDRARALASRGCNVTSEGDRQEQALSRRHPEFF